MTYADDIEAAAIRVRLVEYGRRLEKAMNAERQLDGMAGPEFIAYAVDLITGSQADLARESGITPQTITAIKKGKRPNAGQRAAIYWAIAKAG